MKHNCFKRILVTGLCLVLLLGLLAGCSQTATTPAATTSAGTNSTATAGKIIRIGITQIADHPSLDNCREGFIGALARAGYKQGVNVEFDIQNAQGDGGTANLIAERFVSEGVDLICAIATPSAQSCYNAAQPKKIPVVFSAVSDPVAAQLVAGIGKAGDGITGTSDALPLEKQLKMIRAFLPDAKTIGILYNTSEVNSESQISQLQTLVPKYGFELVTVGVSSAADIPLAADNILNKVDCLNNLTDNLVVSNLATILDKANAKGIPVFGSEEEQVKNGCIACEGIDYIKLGMQTGEMAVKILQGTPISDLPFETILESKPFMNSTVMKKLNITLPADYSQATDLGK